MHAFAYKGMFDVAFRIGEGGMYSLFIDVTHMVCILATVRSGAYIGST